LLQPEAELEGFSTRQVCQEAVKKIAVIRRDPHKGA